MCVSLFGCAWRGECVRVGGAGDEIDLTVHVYANGRVALIAGLGSTTYVEPDAGNAISVYARKARTL